MHSFINIFLVFMMGAILLSGCDIEISNDRIPDIPVINEDFQKKTIAYLKKVIEKDEDNADAYYKLGKIYHEQNENKQALWNISQALKYDSTKSVYLVLYASVNLALNQTEVARKTAAKVEKMENYPYELYRLMAMISFQDSNYVKARDYLNKELLFNPDNFQALQLKAKVHLALRDTASAEENYLKSIVVRPDYKSSYDELMQLYEITGQSQKAVAFVKKYTSEWTNKDINTLMKEATIYRSTGNVDLSKAILKGILEKDSAYYHAYIELASISETENRIDSVEYYLKTAITVKEDFHEARLELARLFDKTRRYYSAMAEYQKILEFDPEHNLAAEELQKIKGKIAYLRKIEEEKQERPALVPLAPKKLL